MRGESPGADGFTGERINPSFEVLTLILLKQFQKNKRGGNIS